MDEDAIREVKDSFHRGEDRLATKIELASLQIKTHMTDRFAHGWDHNLLDRQEEILKNWTKWRDGVETWKDRMMGAIAVLLFLIPILVSVIIALIIRGGKQ